MSFQLFPANQFKIEQLLSIYNQTRADYIVPMPMHLSMLKEYIHVYDIDLSQSLVALIKEKMVGLGFLGIREDQSWITRLGLKAEHRGGGIGQALVVGLIQNSDRLSIRKNVIEVIKENKPAYRLFQKMNFKKKKELLILDRKPTKTSIPRTTILPMGQEKIDYHLNELNGVQSWKNQPESLKKVKNLKGFSIQSPLKEKGWLIYQHNSSNICRLIFNVEKGYPNQVLSELLCHLHNLHPELDSRVENLPENSPFLPVLKKHNYIETFCRIEMVRTVNG